MKQIYIISIMSLLNLPTSLELAKKLKALKVKQESLIWWHVFKDNKYCVKQINIQLYKPVASRIAQDYSAYTSDELDYLLEYYKKQKQNVAVWVRGYPIQQYILETIKDNNIVNTKAKRLIYLIEKKYLVI